MRYLFGFMCVLALSVMGCSETGGDGGSGGTGGAGGLGGQGGAGGVDPSPYASKDLWLCRPDIENNYCDTADLSTTEIQPDGAMVTLTELAPNPDAEVDCFFVYHTVNLSPEPGNTETLDPTDPDVKRPVFKIAAHYRGSCRLFAPLYHQMSLSTYWTYSFGIWQGTEFFKKAYDDVVDAFDYYMRNHNDGRDFVLIGHSQGSHMLTKLLEEKFDDDEGLREQLVSAVLMGPTNRVQVLEGELVGGSFTNIPLCASASETGCVIAFDANPAGVETDYDTAVYYPPPSARACVNPASFDDGPGTLAAFVYPRTYADVIPFPDTVDTQWVSYPEIYTSWCSGADERHVLLVDLAGEYQGEVPITPQELQTALVEIRGFTNANLHGVEYFLTNTDLVRIVEQQIASRGK